MANILDIFAPDPDPAKRQASLDAWAQAVGNSQGRMVGGHYIAGNPLGSLMGQLVKKWKQPQIDAARKEFEAKQQGQLAGELKDFQNLYQGAPEREGALPESGVGPGAPLPATPADPRAAVLKAMTSRLPQMQKIGEGEFNAMLKKEPGKKDIRQIGGRFYDVSSGTPVEVGGGMYKEEMRDGVLGQVAPDGQWTPYKTAPTTQINIGDKQGAKDYYGAMGKTLVPGGEGYKAAKSASQGLVVSSEAANLLAKGVPTGILQPAVQFGRKLLSEVGVDLPATADADQLAAALKESAFKDLGGLGAQISDGDRQFVTEFTGNLATDSRALKRMLALRIARQIREVDSHNEQVNVFSEQLQDPSIKAMSTVSDQVRLADPELKKMVGNILMGRLSTEGLAPTPAPAPSTPATGGLSPDLRARMNRYLQK